MEDYSFLGRDGAVEGIHPMVGPRGAVRYTYGTPARTRYLHLLAWLKAVGEERPACKVKGIDEAIQVACDAWASETGWDTEKMIAALAAVKGTVSFGAKIDQTRGDAK